jgi:putative ABC transport system permease protein
MELRDSLAQGLSDMFSHKLRTFLTMLGVILGVATYIVLFALLKGAMAKEKTWLNEMGGLERVEVKDRESWDVKGKKARWRHAGRTLGDARAIARQTELVRAVAPEAQIWAQLKAGGDDAWVQVRGGTPGSLEANRYEVDRGRFFLPLDQREYRKVCVLGTKTAEQLFGHKDPLGKRVLVLRTNWDEGGGAEPKDKSGIPFTVVGLLKHYEVMEGQRNVIDWKNEAVFIPLATMLKRFKGNENLDNLFVILRDGDRITEGLDRLGNLLRVRHGIDDFNFTTHEEWASNMRRSDQMWQVVLVILGLICLVTGGIGIMNIMLASVNERTREIGIRRALGARRRDILWQFFLETLLISVCGGLLGVGLGVGLGLGFSLLPEQSVLITFPTVAVAFSCSVLVGLFFGIVPARRAAQLNPVEALRYE